MQNLKSLLVYLNVAGRRELAGRLVLSGDQVAWQYSVELQNLGFKLSPFAHPLSSDTYLGPKVVGTTAMRGLPGFIADALPDYWGNRLLEHSLYQAGFTNINALDRLAWQGSRSIGALEFEPEIEEQASATSWGYRQLLLEARAVTRGSLGDVSQALARAGGGLGGAYPKYAAAISGDDQIIVGTEFIPEGYRPALLKVPVDSDVQNRIEHVYALMAKNAGINVPATQLIEAAGGAWFVIDRFDRYGENYLLKRHQSTLAGLLNREFDRELTSAEDALLACKELTLKQSNAIELLRRVVFNYLGHNCDDHAKNVSFHMNEAGEWVLAPWYDGAWCASDTGHAMTLGGSGIPGRKERFYALARKIGFKDIDAVINDVVTSLKGWRSHAEEQGVPGSNIELIQRHIDANLLLMGD